MTASPPKFDIHKHIKEAKASVKSMKVSMPHLFPEWQSLQYADAELKTAQARYDAAKLKWDNL